MLETGGMAQAPAGLCVPWALVPLSWLFSVVCEPSRDCRPLPSLALSTHAAHSPSSCVLGQAVVTRVRFSLVQWTWGGCRCQQHPHREAGSASGCCHTSLGDSPAPQRSLL